MRAHRLFILALAAVASVAIGWAADFTPAEKPVETAMLAPAADVESCLMMIDTDAEVPALAPTHYFKGAKGSPVNLYELPYSRTLSSPDWHRMWINTAVLTGAFTTTLLVLECLPEDATAWNRSEIQSVPMFRRWYNHVILEGPEWDHDLAIFNYVLHPYAGAAYFMSARSCGFNFGQSLLYSAAISTIGWEFGIEAFMERPSIQDIFITPLVGSLIGEGFYHLKHNIINNGGEVLGSRFIGGVVIFLLDPVNEFIGLFAGNPAHRAAAQVRMQPNFSANYVGFSILATF